MISQFFFTSKQNTHVSNVKPGLQQPPFIHSNKLRIPGWIARPRGQWGDKVASLKRDMNPDKAQEI